MNGRTLLVCAWFLVAQATAIELVNRGASPSTLALRIEKNFAGHHTERDVLRRTAPVSVALKNERAFYSANISLGTPPQQLSVDIDTGSNELWVNAHKSPMMCALMRCSDDDTYDANASSTYTYLRSDSSVSFADGGSFHGDFASDTILVAGEQELAGMQFGIGYYSTKMVTSILGVGYKARMARYKEAYPKLPQLLVERGIIQSNAYSLWLDDLESTTGNILFGGVDTEKFHGTLQTLPILEVQPESPRFFVNLTGLSLSKGNRGRSFSRDLPNPVLLDSGTSLTYLPKGLVQDIFAELGLQINSEQLAPIDCSRAKSEETLNFTFNSANIVVPMKELVITLTEKKGDSCIFGIAPTRFGNFFILGDSFLRSAYVVFDLENYEISLAQTNFDATTSSIIEIGKGKGSVPGSAVKKLASVEEPRTSVASAGGFPAVKRVEASSAANGGRAARPWCLWASLVLICGTVSMASG
ncbi:MAG: hypothetical protein Q9223_007025 [Gallowayella weberi]